MKTFGVIVALLACGACSNDMACGCPAASETPLTVVVTPMMGGTCSMGFVNSFGGGQIPVSIAVSPGG